MELRKYPRVQVPSPFPFSFTRVELPVSFSGDTDGQGVVSNLSMKGCHVHSEAVVEVGDHVALRLTIPGQETPLVIELATVRWARTQHFGLEFISMRRTEEARLGQMLTHMASG